MDQAFGCLLAIEPQVPLSPQIKILRSCSGEGNSAFQNSCNRQLSTILQCFAECTPEIIASDKKLFLGVCGDMFVLELQYDFPNV